MSASLFYIKFIIVVVIDIHSCFECGDLDDFIADFPKWNTHKKGNDGGSYDSNKHNGSDKYTFTIGKPKKKLFQKALKDYMLKNKK
ncbi:hypothetical protein GUJ93_ZPchr0012g20779 [Zizania palustris]|uniref:Uncharacterized protein n=1 Tax=Zizania palustris TaxID=103762 RepID=A0A8J5WUR2_ZIZPA|nr:hypothetical protein GUJ93_ZPchr0012g20779 [Zizania palustris]